MSDHHEGIVSAIEDNPVPETTSKYHAIFTSPIECSSLEDLQHQLRRVLETTSLALIPPLVSVHLYLNSNATFNVSSPIRKHVSNDRAAPIVEDIQAASLNDGAVLNPESNTLIESSMTEVLKAANDPKARIKLQAAAAKLVVRAIRDVDGFGYGIQSDFDSTKNGHRFTFGCHDSISNKERKRRAKRLGESEEGSGSKLSKLPTFNCGGEVIVRFQRTLSRIDVSYAHMAIHRNIASRRAQAARRVRKGPPRSIHTSQLQSLTGRGGRGVAKESQADAQAQVNSPLVPSNEITPPVSSERQGPNENDQENVVTRENRPLSRYPSSPLREPGQPDESLHRGTLGTRKRRKNLGSDVSRPSGHTRRAVSTFNSTLQHQLNRGTPKSADTLERKGEPEHCVLYRRGLRDSFGGINDAPHIPPGDMQHPSPDINKSGYQHPIDPELISISRRQYLDHPDWVPSAESTSNGTKIRQERASKHRAKTSQPDVAKKRRKKQG